MNDITRRNLADVAPYAGPHAIPGIRFRPLREALGVSAWGMNVFEIDPGCESYPAHSHANDRQEEVYLVLRGSIVLHADGEEHVLEQGDCVRVAPDVARKFVTRNHAATILALGGTPGEPYKPGMGQPAK